jgi:hypothetical protein
MSDEIGHAESIWGSLILAMHMEMDTQTTRGRGPRPDLARLVLHDNRWSLYSVLIALNVFDLVTTAAVIDHGGSERNPLVQPIIDGIWMVALVKGLVLIVVAILLTRCRESRIADLALAGTTGWYIAVVIWNLVVLSLL